MSRIFIIKKFNIINNEIILINFPLEYLILHFSSLQSNCKLSFYLYSFKETLRFDKTPLRFVSGRCIRRIFHGLDESSRSGYGWFYNARSKAMINTNKIYKNIQLCCTFYSSQVTNHLFKKAGAKFGLDLVSFNMQRGREFGIPSYMEFRWVIAKPSLY